jgi:hypothetical protein
MGQGAPRIGGLIDAERAFWGDPPGHRPPRRPSALFSLGL